MAATVLLKKKAWHGGMATPLPSSSIDSSSILAANVCSGSAGACSFLEQAARSTRCDVCLSLKMGVEPKVGVKHPKMDG